jgi:hypothetical protein
LTIGLFIEGEEVSILTGGGRGRAWGAGEKEGSGVMPRFWSNLVCCFKWWSSSRLERLDSRSLSEENLLVITGATDSLDWLDFW